MSPTTIWMVIFGVCFAVFFIIASWVIVRGGADVLEILSESRKNRLKERQ